MQSYKEPIKITYLYIYIYIYIYTKNYYMSCQIQNILWCSCLNIVEVSSSLSSVYNKSF